MSLFDLTAQRERLALAPDCSRCFGLCCVAHGVKASASFALDKPPGKPCPNLLADFSCTIHRTLRQQGFSGCTAYTCYGAGQKIAQDGFRGTDWRQAPETAELMFQAFPIVRQLNQLLWFITEALDRCSADAEIAELLVLLDATERLAATGADELSWGDVDRHCLMGEALLGQVSATIRAAAVPVERGGHLRRENLRGLDLRGADLRGADLRGADLRGAVLRGADLSGTDLRWADLMGADLGRTQLAGANLMAAIFLTQSQLELADGDTGTAVSGPLRIPAHWSGTDDEPPPDRPTPV